MGDLPRWIKADCAYCETQRTVDMCFLFKPDEDVRQVIGVSAGRALKKISGEVVLARFQYQPGIQMPLRLFGGTFAQALDASGSYHKRRIMVLEKNT